MAIAPENQPHFQTIFELAPDAYYLTDLQGTFIEGNQAAERTVRYSRDELIGKSFLSLNLLSFDDLAKAAGLLARNASGEPTGPDEFTLNLKNGSQVTVEIRTQPVSLDGRTLVLGIARDITQRKQAEEAVRQSDAKYRDLIETTGTGYAILDEAGRVVDANAEYVRLTGHKSLEDILGRSVVEWTAEYDRERNAREVKLCMENRIVQDLEIDYVGPDGSVIPIEIHANVVETAEGVRILALCKDITDRKWIELELQQANDELERRVARRTAELHEANQQLRSEIDERKRAEQQLAQREALYRKAIAAADSVVYQFDFEHDSYVHMDEQIEKLLGYDVSDITPALWEKIVKQKNLRGELGHMSFDEAWHRYQTEDLPLWQADYECVTKGGGTCWLSDSSILLHDEQGVAIGSLGILQDITERKRAEEAARKQLDELSHVARLATAGEMATGLGHELNQPLAAIAIYSDACLNKLRAAPGDCASIIPILEKLREQSLRAGAIVHRIRKYVRKERSRQTASRIEVLVDDVLALLATELNDDAISVSVNIPDELQEVFVDPVQIEQVLLNLVKNAAEAMRADGNDERRIDVWASDREDGFVEVSVRDSGPGMTDEAAAKIFDAFYSTKPEGMGIGLAICRTIVESHGGRITMTPNEGRGVTFRLTLPKRREQ